MAKIQDYYVEAKKYYVEANLRPKNTHNEKPFNYKSFVQYKTNNINKMLY